MTKPYNCEEQVVEPLSEGKLRVQMASQEDEFVRSLVIRNPPMKPNEVQDFLDRWVEQGKSQVVVACQNLYYKKPLDTVILPRGRGKAMVALRTGTPTEDGGLRFDRLVVSLDPLDWLLVKDNLTLALSLAGDEESPVKYLACASEDRKSIKYLPLKDVAAIAPFEEKVAERNENEKPATSVARLSPIAGAVGKCFPTEEA